MNEYDKKYKKLIQYVLSKGIEQRCRNGYQLIIPFYNFNLNFSKKNNHILNLRKINYKPIIGEFTTLINTKNKLVNIKQFKNNSCNYWDKWADKYGKINLDYYNMLHPQLQLIIDQIKNDPYSRRHIIELWNYKNVFSKSLSLPCCWHNLTFSVINTKLFMSFTIRSNDIMVGNPADIYLAYLFHKHVADHTGYNQSTCNFSIRNAHIYKEHVNNAIKLLKRTNSDYNKPLYFKLKE